MTLDAAQPVLFNFVQCSVLPVAENGDLFHFKLKKQTLQSVEVNGFAADSQFQTGGRLVDEVDGFVGEEAVSVGFRKSVLFCWIFQAASFAEVVEALPGSVCWLT